LVSHSLQPSLSTVVAADMAAVGVPVAVVPTAAAVAVSIAVESEVPMGVEASAAVVAELAAVAVSAASDRLAEEVIPTAAGLKLAVISARRKVVRQVFLPPLAMASGIRSAAPAVPCVPAQDEIPEMWRTRPSPLATPECPMALGTPLPAQALLRQEASSV